MSDAIKALRDYLSKSPSVIYPQDVLEYLPAIEAENAALRELCADLYDHAAFSIGYFGDVYGILPRMKELGMEVDE